MICVARENTVRDDFVFEKWNRASAVYRNLKDGH
jgi:hypothetical protein